jgi:hypothetical protein
MPTYKVQCTNPNFVCAPSAYGNARLESWEDHPALKAALDCLNIYNHWVSQRVIPIAFQWIEDHRAEVYRNMPADKQEDMGAVIASAFDIVRRNPKFQQGLDLADAIEKGSINPSSSNPHWAGVASKLHDNLAEAFDRHEAQLMEMVAQMRPTPVSTT